MTATPPPDPDALVDKSQGLGMYEDVTDATVAYKQEQERAASQARLDAKKRTDEHTAGLHPQTICGNNCGGCVSPEEGGGDVNRILVDLVTWLGTNRVMLSTKLPGGASVYGPAKLTADEIVKRYWESYQ